MGSIITAAIIYTAEVNILVHKSLAAYRWFSQDSFPVVELVGQREWIFLKFLMQTVKLFSNAYTYQHWSLLLVSLLFFFFSFLKPKTDSQFIVYFFTSSEAGIFHIIFFHFIFLLANCPCPLTLSLPSQELSCTIEKCPPPNYKTQVGSNHRNTWVYSTVIRSAPSPPTPQSSPSDTQPGWEMRYSTSFSR